MTILIRDLTAAEILDSRGRPTLQVELTLDDLDASSAAVPSGASTGSREAVERRDHDVDRYGGLGVREAVAGVNGEIADSLRGRRFSSLDDVDAHLIELDGTPDKSRLGANAVVGVSMAATRAFAHRAGVPLWRYLEGTVARPRLPVPFFNVVNGGVHAPNDLDFQEFMVAPLGAPTVAEALRCGVDVYGALRRRLSGEGLQTGLGDEGGFAPEIDEPERVLSLLVAAIDEAGYSSGPEGVGIAIDPASSEFYRDGAYHVAGNRLSSDEMIEWYAELIDRYPLWLLEDGLAESDWEGWGRLTERLGHRVELVGDDIFCTNVAIIQRAIDQRIANSSLIKVNQIGTVSETIEAMRVCDRAGYAQFVSHRSGETVDDFIADLAVGTGCGHMKSGAPARGERVAKYNRLLKIESDSSLAYGGR